MTNQAIVSIQKLNHFFGEGTLRKQILFDIDLEVKPREFVILTGPSGSGKSTLLGLIGCLRSVQQGSLKILGQELNGANNEHLVQMRRRFGYITQASNLLQFLTARQNVQISLELHPELSSLEMQQRSIAMLEAVGLGDKVDCYPDQLSGGQRQRVAIACALVTQPKLVLADEPTAALDKVSGRNVMALMHRLAKEQGSAVITVTHDNRILDLADRIIKVEDGKLGIALSQELAIALPGFNEALFDEAATKPTVLTYQSEEVIVRQGEVATKFYVILEGEVEVWQELPNQETKLVGQLHRGQYFGEIGLLQGGIRTATVRVAANSEVKVMVMEEELFRRLMADSALTSADIARRMAQRSITSHLAIALPTLSPQDLSAALSQAQIIRYGPNSNIIQAGEPARKFYLVARGQVEVLVRNEQGQELQQRILSAGGYFGEQELVIGRSYGFTVRVLSDAEAEIIVLDRQTFCDLIAKANVSQEQVAEILRDRLVKHQSHPTTESQAQVAEIWHDRAVEQNSRPTELTLYEDLVNFIPGFDRSLLGDVTTKPVVEVYAAGETIVQQGELATKFYVILEGAVEVFLEVPGFPSRLLKRMGQGEYFGEVGLLQAGKRIATVRAAEDASVKAMVIEEELFQLMLANCTLTSKDIAERLHERVVMSYLATALPNLSPDQLVEVLTRVRVVRYEPGTAIVRQGEQGSQFYLIAKGAVEFIIQNDREQEFIVQTMQRGQNFGEAELLEGQRYGFSVQAASNTEVELLILDRQSFCQLVIESNTSHQQVASVLRNRLLNNTSLRRVERLLTKKKKSEIE